MKKALDENSNRLDFEIPTQYCTYDFKIMAYNANGEKVQTDARHATVDYDNIPPSGPREEEYIKFYNPNGCILSSPEFTDDKSGLLKKDWKIPVKYFYGNVWLSEEYSNNQSFWNSDAVRTVLYEGSGDLLFPFDGHRVGMLHIQIAVAMEILFAKAYYLLVEHRPINFRQ